MVGASLPTTALMCRRQHPEATAHAARFSDVMTASTYLSAVDAV
jgi:hypothetical protein